MTTAEQGCNINVLFLKLAFENDKDKFSNIDSIDYYLQQK